MDANNVTDMQEENEFDKDYKSREYVCPVCGKTFRIPMYISLTSYVYVVNVYDPEKKKNSRKKCCSYACYRKGSS